MWLHRFPERVIGEGRPAGAQERRVARVLGARATYPRPGPFFADLLATLPAGQPLSTVTVARLAEGLRGDPHRRPLPDQDGQLQFWRALSDRFPDDAHVAACHGDVLLAGGDEAAALGRFVAACELEPGLLGDLGGAVSELAEIEGGEPLLRYQLCELRAALAEDEPDDEYVRERYSELLEDHQGDAAALARIRELGVTIEALVASGALPRALVRRGRWRSG